MYHGANSFAKENYRETTSAGCGCHRPFPDNRCASEYGRWQSLASRGRLTALKSNPDGNCNPVAVVQNGKKLRRFLLRRVSQLKKEQCQGYSALQCSL